MRSPPILDQSPRDLEAQRQSEVAQQDGRNIVRSHLENHATHNPGRSGDYVSWIATLHPENADVSIDTRFLIPGNPWWSIYEQYQQQEQERKKKEREQQAEPMIAATGVPVTLDHGGSTKDGDSASIPAPPKPPHVCLRCSPVNIFIGVFVSFFAILGVLIVEITSLFLPYLLGAIFYNLARPFDPPRACTAFFYNLFMCVYQLMAFIDSICLFLSSLISEVLALAVWIFIVLFGGIWAANQYHQWIRINCHLIRSMFRSHWTSPRRHFVLCCGDHRHGSGVTVEEVHGFSGGSSGDDEEFAGNAGVSGGNRNERNSNDNGPSGGGQAAIPQARAHLEPEHGYNNGNNEVYEDLNDVDVVVVEQTDIVVEHEDEDQARVKSVTQAHHLY
mmetsp:Transcript_5257/g.15364  ORF Transcript_5257/g.15364 Transcript_5257/m.15364 type:complete len:389 (+) Transcript_5257:199-1365(+)|eukprot:CAMPEP_0119546734 /NCGR_PEP_ID=MMETSP1352-20130426/1019_1 /TAXON_ID=265584 /ORGANISM="Stauroneis constricta, Strain CCMP1120" /LENGTH=388 /DNA_ID=CAMNT_0007591459 /DNA_START=193 /DNA_END=1359 /DNA_ORIENTATION=+